MRPGHHENNRLRQLRVRLSQFTSRLSASIHDHEIYVRSNGRVRFLKISRGFQLKAASAAAAGVCVWLAASGAMLVSQFQVSEERAAIVERARVINRTASKVEAYRTTIDGKAGELEARQQILDALAEQYFGDTNASVKIPASAAAATKPRQAATSDATDLGAARFNVIERTQLAFADRVTKIANARADRAETAVRQLGLSPERLARSAPAVGGPFVPFGGGRGSGQADTRLVRLYAALSRLDGLERAMLALPSFTPASGSALTSRFGFRFDPFTRWPAMHMGQDFSGRRGQPIYAAAPGRVVRAGWWSGYGKAVQIDHGRGLETRYGHMSALDVRPGERVKRGQLIGRMGSTGRSTGTHLHFEVRSGGRAVNPRPFLEASHDVLKIQTRVRQRIDGTRHAG